MYVQQLFLFKRIQVGLYLCFFCILMHEEMRVLSMLVEKDTRLQYNHLWLLGFLLLQSQSYINIVNHINKRDSFVDIHLAYQFTLWDELLWIWSSTLYLATNFPNGGHVHRLSSKPRAQQSTWDFLFIIILEVLFLFLVLDLCCCGVFLFVSVLFCCFLKEKYVSPNPFLRGSHLQKRNFVQIVFEEVGGVKTGGRRV